MLSQLAKGLVILALTLSLGAHWAFLQSVAWAGMLYTYSNQAGFAQAISMTFDGDHPCSLCKVIQQGKAHEQQKKEYIYQPSQELKLDLPLRNFMLHAPTVERMGFGSAIIVPRLPEPPDAPPPRLVPA